MALEAFRRSQIATSPAEKAAGRARMSAQEAAIADEDVPQYSLQEILDDENNSKLFGKLLSNTMGRGFEPLIEKWRTGTIADRDVQRLADLTEVFNERMALAESFNRQIEELDDSQEILKEIAGLSGTGRRGREFAQILQVVQGDDVLDFVQKLVRNRVMQSGGERAIERILKNLQKVREERTSPEYELINSKIEEWKTKFGFSDNEYQAAIVPGNQMATTNNMRALVARNMGISQRLRTWASQAMGLDTWAGKTLGHSGGAFAMADVALDSAQKITDSITGEFRAVGNTLSGFISSDPKVRAELRSLVTGKISQAREGFEGGPASFSQASAERKKLSQQKEVKDCRTFIRGMETATGKDFSTMSVPEQDAWLDMYCDRNIATPTQGDDEYEEGFFASLFRSWRATFREDTRAHMKANRALFNPRSAGGGGGRRRTP